MDDPSGMRRSYREKSELLLDLAMLLFGGLVRLLQRRRQTPPPAAPEDLPREPGPRT